jgi:hypothetical protein
MFLDGTALFDLSQLLAFRRGEYDPSVALQAIEDDALKSMVLHMIQPAADMRLSAAEYARPAPLSLKLLQLGADGVGGPLPERLLWTAAWTAVTLEHVQVLRHSKHAAHTPKAVTRRRAQLSGAADEPQQSLFQRRLSHPSWCPCRRRSVARAGVTWLHTVVVWRQPHHTLTRARHGG